MTLTLPKSLLSDPKCLRTCTIWHLGPGRWSADELYMCFTCVTLKVGTAIKNRHWWSAKTTTDASKAPNYLLDVWTCLVYWYRFLLHWTKLWKWQRIMYNCTYFTSFWGMNMDRWTILPLSCQSDTMRSFYNWILLNHHHHRNISIIFTGQ